MNISASNIIYKATLHVEESIRDSYVPLEKRHQEAEANEHHHMDILEHCRFKPQYWTALKNVIILDSLSRIILYSITLR